MVAQIPNKDRVILNHYVLPLVNLSINKLPHYTKKIFINYDGNLVFIQFLKNPATNFSTLYHSTIEYKEYYYQVYSIPEIFINDMRLLIKGKYSQMSLKAKTVIIQDSGLNYMVKNETTGKLTTASALLALDKRPELRIFLEKKLSQDPDVPDVSISPEADLMDKLTTDVFIDNVFDIQE